MRDERQPIDNKQRTTKAKPRAKRGFCIFLSAVIPVPDDNIRGQAPAGIHGPACHSELAEESLARFACVFIFAFGKNKNVESNYSGGALRMWSGTDTFARGGQRLGFSCMRPDHDFDVPQSPS